MNEILRMLEDEYQKTLDEYSLLLSDEEDKERALRRKLEMLHSQRMDCIQKDLETQKLVNEEANKRAEQLNKKRELDLRDEEFSAKLHHDAHQEAMDELESDHRARELKLKEDQLKEQKVDRIVNVATTAITVGVPITASWIWMKRGLKFEETGTFTSRTGNWITNSLKLFGKK